MANDYYRHCLARKLQNDAAADNGSNYRLLQETTAACVDNELTLREYETLWGPPEAPFSDSIAA
jgi:hypothetical protein